MIGGWTGHRVAHSRPWRRAANLGRKIQSVFVRVTRLTVSQTLHVFALTALAVAHPLFDVVSREPSFFVARNTTAANLVALVAVVCIALPIALVAIEVALARFSATAASVAHGVVITVLGAALLLPLLKRAEVLGAAPSITVTLTVAGIAALAYRRFDVVRTFLTLLSPAVVVVPAVFLMNADVRGAVVRTDDLFSSVHPRGRAADRHCCLRRISSQLLVGRQSRNRSGALPELRASGYDCHVVSQRQHRVLSAGISDLPAPDGPFIRPKAAERTKFCSAYNRPAPEAVTSAHADVEPTGAAVFRAFLKHRSTLVPFLRQPSLHSAARQPAGTGSAQILRSISPKSRRFR